ncbi:PepSY domain-containing protein [Streptomyces griseus]|uniref:PepSY domain-containing protein n=1 Tax=Streptomyces griseus TaxID=1911 RepID=UPI000568C603|nr:PepSY domain-containing protein [Streptomyces griseus]
MKRHLVAVSTITAVALIGGGATLAFGAGGEGDTPAKSPAAVQGDDRDTDAQDERDDRDDRDGDAAEARGSKLTAAQAIDVALKAKPGTAVSADLEAGDDEDDVRGWEVDVLGSGSTSYTVHVDDRTGKILATETERDDDAAEAHRALKVATVDAKQAAEAAAPEGTVTSVDLDDDRSPRWDVETMDTHGKDHDWNVDVKTAKVTADRDDD